jgi:hypothetical protein
MKKYSFFEEFDQDMLYINELPSIVGGIENVDDFDITSDGGKDDVGKESA